jgi:heterotetrameric sarcosine oxidase gamma subunit
VSKPEHAPLKDAASDVTLESWSVDVTELAASRGCTPELEQIATARGVELPTLGRSIRSGDHLALCVRPNRWLIVSTPSAATPAAAGEAAASWSAACAGVGIAIDLSCALSAFHLSGESARDVVARNCRVDLDPEVFSMGSTAATIMAQVSVVLTSLDSGILLLTPATTARHFSEWLAAALPGDPSP